jgi:hypothetical protein
MPFSSSPIASTQIIETICQTVPGWCPPDQMLALHTLALGQSEIAGDVIEIGSWCGRSALAFAAATFSPAKVHCIDLFPSRTDWRQDPAGDYYIAVELAGELLTGNKVHTTWRDVWEAQIAPVYDRWPSLRQAFDACVAQFDFGHVISAHQGTIQTYLRGAGAGVRCKLAYIDGSHDPEHVRADLAAVECLLVPGAWVCFDDAFTSAPGIDDIIREKILINPSYGPTRQLTRKLFAARYNGQSRIDA